MDESLERIAVAYGIAPRYTAIDGSERMAPDDAVIELLRVSGIEVSSPEARANLLEDLPQTDRNEMRVPGGTGCYLPDFLESQRCWGVTCQLYGLRSRRNWGIGDFEDLARLGEMMAGFGADFLGVNPLHALFLAAPEWASPFSPSDRSFLNPLYIAVDQVAGLVPAADLDERVLTSLREAPLVDYRHVANIKLAALRRIHERREGDRNDAAYRRFVEAGGEELHRHALFQAIGLSMVRDDRQAGWMSWPEALQDPSSAEVADFARTHANEVDFQLWLQWIADHQLAAASEQVSAAGMRIGLYLDLAVGTSPDGSATWSDRALTVVGAEIGAPPDMFNPNGQKWGLAPVSPPELAARDFEPARKSYDAVLRHAGALRIDHAMSVHRLFWIPWERPAADGAYVLYSMSDIVRALAETSQKRRAVIIGEDLGVVPDGFRDQMEAASMLGYRLFFFERNDNGFIPPHHWTRNALACVGSHDTATLAGWWTGSDIATRRDIGLYDGASAEIARADRLKERREAVELLRGNGIDISQNKFDETVAAGVHRLVARTPARMFAAQLEDLIGEVEQPNVPGTVDEHPNWRRRMAVFLEDLPGHTMLRAVLAAVAEERPR